MRGFARAVAVIALVAALVAAADPASQPTIGRVVVFAVAVAAAASLTLRLARVVPRADRSPFEPRAVPRPVPEVPVELARLAASFQAMGTGERVDGHLRATLRAVAASRLRHHGVSLDAPDKRVRRVLGDPLVDALRHRRAPDDPEDLLRPLEDRWR